MILSTFLICLRSLLPSLELIQYVLIRQLASILNNCDLATYIEDIALIHQAHTRDGVELEKSLEKGSRKLSQSLIYFLLLVDLRAAIM